MSINWHSALFFGDHFFRSHHSMLIYTTNTGQHLTYLFCANNRANSPQTVDRPPDGKQPWWTPAITLWVKPLNRNNTKGTTKAFKIVKLNKRQNIIVYDFKELLTYTLFIDTHQPTQIIIWFQGAVNIHFVYWNTSANSKFYDVCSLLNLFAVHSNNEFFLRKLGISFLLFLTNCKTSW